MRSTHEEGQAIADALMSQWREKNPDRDWVKDELEKHALVQPADNSALVGRGQGQTYGQISKQDVATWSRESMVMAANGSRVFHDANELGSTIAVSCDMCHPHAANTHPETYPKFQVQLGRVALLRDMINWCIEHPVRGTPLAARRSQDAGPRGLHLRAAQGSAAGLRPPLSARRRPPRAGCTAPARAST